MGCNDRGIYESGTGRNLYTIGLSKHSGILSRVRSNSKRGKGGKGLYKYLKVLLNDPCVYCGEFGADSIDHILAKSRMGADKWENYAPAHEKCNRSKGSKGLVWNLLKLSG